MENASKALIIAGSVLISMLVIAALIFTFSQVRSLRSQEQLSEQTDEVAEYNNKFNKYASDNLYGVDLISLCNEVANYNAHESENKYYQAIRLEFDFTNSINDPLEGYIKKQKYEYIKNDNPSSNNLYKKYTEFQEDFNNLANSLVTSKYTVKQVATMRSDEIKNKIGTLSTDMEKKISDYNKLKTSFTEFKTKKFKGKITEQDNTGRITKMEFTS